MPLRIIPCGLVHGLISGNIIYDCIPGGIVPAATGEGQYEPLTSAYAAPVSRRRDESAHQRDRGQ